MQKPTEPKYGKNPKPWELRKMHEEVRTLTLTAGEPIPYIYRPGLFNQDLMIPLCMSTEHQSPRRLTEMNRADNFCCSSCKQLLAISRGDSLDCFAFKVTVSFELVCLICETVNAWCPGWTPESEKQETDSDIRSAI